MKKAWIEDNRVRDIAPGNPADLYHPDIAQLYDTDVPDEVQNGWSLVEGQWRAPPEPEPQEAAPVVPGPIKVSPVEFKLLFTAPERVAIKAMRATDPVIDDFYEVVEDPRLTHVDLGLKSTRDAIGYLAAQNLITAERATEILAGVVP